MGSDDLFHKRKARRSAALQRQKHQRAPNKRYLIVCEGTKTEPYYFRELLDDLRIRAVCIARNNDGVSPCRVVEHALDLYEEDAASGDAYDTVYCVFDRDRHTTFDDAVARIQELSDDGKPLAAITSTPCFEFWLLLHFGYTDQPFHAAGAVVKTLKTKPGFEKYRKSQKGIYAQLKNKLDSALNHAGKLRRHTKAVGIDNPATDIDKLVQELRKLGH